MMIRRGYYEIKPTSVRHNAIPGAWPSRLLSTRVVKVSVPATRHFLTPKRYSVNITNIKGLSARVCHVDVPGFW